MVTTYVAIVATSLILMTGLVVDGGGKIATYVEASQLADGAARAAAQAVSQADLYQSGTVRLDAAGANARARGFAARSNHRGAIYRVVTRGNTVTVTVRLRMTAKMLPGMTGFVYATESATALRGVETGR
jgi:hypothetical protein